MSTADSPSKAPREASAASPPDPSAPRPHRKLVAGLLVVAVLVGVVALLSTWVKRQVLETDNWVNTSSNLLADPKIQAAVGTYAVDELFSNVDVAAALRANLPAQFRGIAGPVAGGLQQVAERAAPELLARPRVQDAWRLANRTAHAQLIKVLNGGGTVVSTRNGEVVLNLRPLITQLAASLGLQSQLAAARSKLTPGVRSQVRSVAQQRGIALPPSTGQLVIMKSKQLKTAQDVAWGIRGLSIAFAIVFFALLVAVCWLARGWRRVALRRCGWVLIGIGLVTLVIRRFVGNHVVASLVKADSAKPAVHDAWMIGTSLLRAIALALVVYGLVVVLAAWLAGPTRAAQAVRRALAPSLRDHPVRVYVTAGAVYLLVLLWGPTPALRHFVPIVILGVLIVLGIEELRRQAAREWPDAAAGDTARRLQEWWAGRRRRPHGPADAVAGNGGHPARLDQLERLASLHDRGAITDEEYAAEKGVLLGS